MDTKHIGDAAIGSVKGYLWFLCLNIIFSLWLLVRVFSGGAIMLPGENYVVPLFCVIGFSALNLLTVLVVREGVNEGFYRKCLPAIVLTFGVLWAILFFHLFNDFRQPTITMVILTIILLPATITFYISGRLLALFSTPIVFSLIYGEFLSPGKFNVIQTIGAVIILVVVLSARYILLEAWQRTQRSEYEKSLLIKKLVKLANYDTLTGLFNRRSMNEFFAETQLQLAQSDKSLFLIVLDIDFFKQYNDIYGHVAGDKCLIEVARCIEESLRKASDAAFRLGGEEFVVLAVCDSMENAVSISRRIQKALSDLRLRHTGSSVSDRITLSQGIARWQPGMPLETLLELADKALYQAKRDGRNRIVTD